MSTCHRLKTLAIIITIALQATVACASPLRCLRPVSLLQRADPMARDTAIAEVKRTLHLTKIVPDDELRAIRADMEAALSQNGSAGHTTADYQALLRRYDEYLQGTPAQRQAREKMGLTKPKQIVAYFTAEALLHNDLPTYSGGLGGLAGDESKGFSDKNGRGFVGVMLGHNLGYFRQVIQQEPPKDYGWQQAWPDPLKFEEWGELVMDPKETTRRLLVPVEIEGETVYTQVWRIRVGRSQWLLLDTDIDENGPNEYGSHRDLVWQRHRSGNWKRHITDRLYDKGRKPVGDDSHVTSDEAGEDYLRLRQEMLRGIGGIRALKALGYDISALHLNESHNAFAAIEMVNQEMIEARRQGTILSLADAITNVANRTITTSHTPVPAGNEKFNPATVEQVCTSYFRSPKNEFGGAFAPLPWFEDKGWLNMAQACLTLSGAYNGVSDENRQVATEMFGREFFGIVNAVHFDTWVREPMRHFLRMTADRIGIHGALHELTSEEKERIATSIDRPQYAERVRTRRVKAVKELKGIRPHQQEHLAHLKADAFTITVARRFATYKEALLVLKIIEELREAAGAAKIPLQIIFAGKAHPIDEGGIDLIHELHQRIKSNARNDIFFIENYDESVEHCLADISDVWLSNPRAQKESSQTSSMKAVVNGGTLTVSTPVGWVLEAKNALDKNGNPNTIDKADGAAILFPIDPDDVGNDECGPKTAQNLLPVLAGLIQIWAQRNSGDPTWWNMVINAQLDVWQNFTMERFIDDYSLVYKEAIAGRLRSWQPPRQFYLPMYQRTAEAGV